MPEAASYEVKDFQQQVLARSREMPVLVDFWAVWCGPCKTLGPVLEKLASEATGRWEFVKVDVDRNQQLAASYQVRGIPAVKLFVDGRVANEFSGALPEAAVREWLGRALPAPADRSMAAVRQAVADGDEARAKTLLEEILAAQPEHPQARVLLGRLLLFDAPGRCLDLLAPIGLGAPEHDMAEAVRFLAGLLATTEGELPEDPARADCLAGVEALRGRQFEIALRRFIESVVANKLYRDGAARQACVAIFRLLGDDDELTRAYRRKLQRALN